MNDSEEQDDELIALESIYASCFTIVKDDLKTGTIKGGELTIYLDLPQDFQICYLRMHNGKYSICFLFFFFFAQI